MGYKCNYCGAPVGESHEFTCRPMNNPPPSPSDKGKTYDWTDVKTPASQSPREFDIEAICHRIKRLHELGPNHEHFKLGDMDCESLLLAFEALQRELDRVKAIIGGHDIGQCDHELTTANARISELENIRKELELEQVEHIEILAKEYSDRIERLEAALSFLCNDEHVPFGIREIAREALKGRI